MAAAHMVARVHATLAHIAPEGWMPQRLECSLSSCGELHIKNAPFEKSSHSRLVKKRSGRRDGDYQRDACQPLYFLSNILRYAQTHNPRRSFLPIIMHFLPQVYFFCVLNSISSRQYLPWPPPAERRAPSINMRPKHKPHSRLHMRPLFSLLH